jgi:hypothetical protein
MCFVSPPSRGLPDGKSLSFASPKESNQRKGAPNIRPIPAVLATGGTKTNRPMARFRARWAHGFGLGPPVAPLLGVEYTGTPLGRMLDRFAIWFRGFECEHPSYFVVRAVIPTAIMYKRIHREDSTTCMRVHQMTKCSIEKLCARRFVKKRSASRLCGS